VRCCAAQVQGSAIAATSEFAAVQFIAQATGSNPNTVAHVAIVTIAAIPDVLAVLLLVAAGYSVPAAPQQEVKIQEVKTQEVKTRKAKRRHVRKLPQAFCYQRQGASILSPKATSMSNHKPPEPTPQGVSLPPATSAAEMLDRIGRSLFGQDWQSQLAASLGVRRDTIRKWLHGSIPFDFRHGIWPQILKILDQRQAELKAMETELRCGWVRIRTSFEKRLLLRMGIRRCSTANSSIPRWIDLGERIVASRVTRPGRSWNAFPIGHPYYWPPRAGSMHYRPAGEVLTGNLAFRSSGAGPGDEAAWSQFFSWPGDRWCQHGSASNFHPRRKIQDRPDPLVGQDLTPSNSTRCAGVIKLCVSRLWCLRCHGQFVSIALGAIMNIELYGSRIRRVFECWNRLLLSLICISVFAAGLDLSLLKTPREREWTWLVDRIHELGIHRICLVPCEHPCEHASPTRNNNLGTRRHCGVWAVVRAGKDAARLGQFK